MKRITCLTVAAVLAIAGCTSGGDGSTTSPSSSPPSSPATVTASPSTATTTATPTKTPTSTPTSTPSPTRKSAATTTGTPPRTTSACTNAQLAVSHRSLPGAASHSGVIIVFRNTGKATCDLVGYPGAAVVDRSGQQFEQATRTVKGFLGGADGPPRTVMLRPSASASARIEGDNGGGDECLRGEALLVTPPNTEQSTRVPFKDYSCHIQVHPTVAGTQGGKAA